MSFVIGCDSFLSLRNVRNGRLGEYLQEVHAWVDPAQLEGGRLACPEGVVVDQLVDFSPDSDPSLARALNQTHWARKAWRDGRTIWSERMAAIGRKSHSKGLGHARMLASSAVDFSRGWIGGVTGRAQRGRRECAGMLRRHAQQPECAARLEAVGATMVSGLSPEGYREMLLLETANSLGLPTAVMIRSRDNLAAKIKHLPYAHRYLVWSEATRQVFLHMYPEEDPDRVLVTGSPQFDRHLDLAYRLDREAWAAAVGLDPGRPIIAYTMATPGLIDHEIDITQHLADTAHAGGFAGGAQLLVRGHPRMFGSSLKLLHQEYPEARAFPRPTEHPHRSPGHEAQVVQRLLEDEPIHLATIAHQAVQVNVCGTMTIDSAILDRPTVNIYYDEPASVPAGASVRTFYERSDVRHMMAYGASRLARSPEECVRLINAYLEDPTLDAAGRRRAREEDCGPLDGRAGERIATIFRSLEQARA